MGLCIFTDPSPGTVLEENAPRPFCAQNTEPLLSSEAQEKGTHEYASKNVTMHLIEGGIAYITTWAKKLINKRIRPDIFYLNPLSSLSSEIVFPLKMQKVQNLLNVTVSMPRFKVTFKYDRLHLYLYSCFNALCHTNTYSLITISNYILRIN